MPMQKNKRMKKIVLFITFFSLLHCTRADEGMWIPLFLHYNEAEMQQLGFTLTAEDIYSVNQNSMKDAIVLFGGGCTGELISPEGLLITNHHCGYSYVQAHSTLENNYLHNGFWAKSKSDEIPNNGLTVTFLIRMEDVTKAVLAGVSEELTEPEREKMIKENSRKITDDAVKGTHYTAIIKPFYYGNQYFMFINETFQDVRLVGVPPESIGKFGGDTDNWMWPRHTGDFSLYRIYTGKDGKPAEYSPENIPLKSKKYFHISTRGIEENDFTLVFGYPGTTRQFLISDAVKVITEVQNPVAIHQRGVRLDIMKKYMDRSLETRLMYSAKANSISNGWKKWIGENKGLEESKVIEKKRKEEEEFVKWANTGQRADKYGNLLEEMKEHYRLYTPYVSGSTYFLETFPAIELIRFAYSNFLPVIYLSGNKGASIQQWETAISKLEERTENFYTDFYKPIDKEIFVELLYYYFSTIHPALIPSELQRYMNVPKEELRKMAEDIYEKSVFSSKETALAFIRKGSKKEFQKLASTLLFQLTAPAFEQYFQNQEILTEINNKLTIFYRTYVKALMEKDTDKTFYPDANLTMRVTYGQVKGFYPEDGKEYLYYTRLEGVMEKENPLIFDYQVDPKLKALYEKKEYGRYANEKGELPVAFIASNHTTGGNSGSPVINGRGELIGVNFDRVWEGTMSDIHYDVNRCRNISLDIRYFLFIVDKFADAQNIIHELTIVE